MHKIHVNPICNPSPTLCHLPDAFFKDLQTNFPETFRAYSVLHQSCFTLLEFTKNRPNREAPQHTPAKPFAIAQNAVTHLMSPSILQDLRASNALAFTLGPLAPRYLGPSFHLMSPCESSNPRPIQSPNHQKGATSRMPPRDLAAQNFDFLTFGRFDFSLRRKKKAQREPSPQSPNLAKGGGTSRMKPPGAAAQSFDVLTFRRFDVSRSSPPPPSPGRQRPNPCSIMHPNERRRTNG